MCLVLNEIQLVRNHIQMNKTNAETAGGEYNTRVSYFSHVTLFVIIRICGVLRHESEIYCEYSEILTYRMSME